VKVLSAKSVTVRDSEIYRFQAGIAVVPTSAQTRVRVLNNDIHDNGVGVINAPGNNTITFTTATLRNNDIHDNTCGAAVSAGGTNASTPNANTNCGTAATGAINKTAVIRAFHNGFNDNGEGVYSRGAIGVFEIAYNEITGNSVFGIHRVDSGIVRTFSPATNVVSDNAASDAPNATVPMQRVVRR
jgi:hypothetical protein